MGYSWFRVDAAVVDHPKVLELAEILKQPLAVAYVLRLWSWAQRYAPSGAFSARAAAQLERVLNPEAAPVRVFDALVSAGLVDEPQKPGDQFTVHDWELIQGHFVDKSLRDAEVKRLKRAEMRARRENGAETARAEKAPGAETAPKRRPNGAAAAPPTRRDETKRDEKLLREPAFSGNTELISENPPAETRKDPEISDGWGFFLEHQRRRRLATGRKEREMPPAADKLDAWFRKATEQLGGLEPLLDALNGFFADKDPFWREKDYPFAGFMQQWLEWTELVATTGKRLRGLR